MGKNHRQRSFGVNDADYEVQHCPYYTKWDNALRRFRRKGNPIYQPWIDSFMAFRAHLMSRNWDEVQPIVYTKPNMHPKYLIFSDSYQSDAGLFKDHEGVAPAHGSKGWVAHFRNEHIGSYPTKALATAAYKKVRNKAREGILNANHTKI